MIPSISKPMPSILLQDRLLLVLSKHSVKRSGVRDAVEAALEREGCEKRLVLFPIRIDDEVMRYEPNLSGGCTTLKIQ